MDPILIVKLGSTFASLAASRGDFEDWIRTGLAVPPESVQVVDARCQSLPDPGSLAGVVLTGSHVMVTEHLPWSEATARWTAQAVGQAVPVLGICYGHQLLAYALGGEVGPNSAGREFGTVELTLSAAAGEDSLFGDAPSRMLGNACHAQSVLKLPPGARCLASSRRDGCQAFAVGRQTWGVQFHPEFDGHVMRTYLQECRGLLEAEGQVPERLCEAVRETPESAALLRRFACRARGVSR